MSKMKPPEAYYYTHLAAYLWYLTQEKPPTPAGKTDVEAWMGKIDGVANNTNEKAELTRAFTKLVDLEPKEPTIDVARKAVMSMIAALNNKFWGYDCYVAPEKVLAICGLSLNVGEILPTEPPKLT